MRYQRRLRHLHNPAATTATTNTTTTATTINTFLPSPAPLPPPRRPDERAHTVLLAAPFFQLNGPGAFSGQGPEPEDDTVEALAAANPKYWHCVEPLCAGHIADSIRIAGLIPEIESVVSECVKRASGLETMVPATKAVGKQVSVPRLSVSCVLYVVSSQSQTEKPNDLPFVCDGRGTKNIKILYKRLNFCNKFIKILCII